MSDPLVVAAAIGSVPATIAAYAALRANYKVSTNGSKKNIGILVELINSKLDDHIQDPDAHED